MCAHRVHPTNSVPINEWGNVEAIRFRLHKAFPEIAVFFPLLTKETKNGKPWREVCDAYTDKLDDQQLTLLFREINDLFSMGWLNGDLFDTVTCSIFGLDSTLARKESGDVWKFVATVEERLSGERLRRHI